MTTYISIEAPKYKSMEINHSQIKEKVNITDKHANEAIGIGNLP